MRACIFCGNSADSREDAWPRWLTERFQSTELIDVQAERRGVSLKPWRLRRPGLAVRCVCRSCNNGWMSDLENKAKPLLEPMLNGKRTILDLAAQTTIAVWGMKIAMVLECIDASEGGRFTSLERTRLRTLSVIPSRTSAWLAASAQSSFIFSARTEHRASIPTEATGFATTLVFGHVALQYFTIRLTPPVPESARVTVDVRAGPWGEVTIPIWPANHDYNNVASGKGLERRRGSRPACGTVQRQSSRLGGHSTNGRLTGQWSWRGAAAAAVNLLLRLRLPPAPRSSLPGR